MTKNTNITYTDVASACAEILKLGEKPSIRRIHERIGGSYSTISTFYRQWQQSTHEASLSDLSISESLKQALLSEFSKVSTLTKQQFSEKLANDQQQAQEAVDLLAEYEVKFNALTTELSASSTENQALKISYEKQIAVLEEKESSAKREVMDLRQQMLTINDAYSKCQVDLAVYKERCLLIKSTENQMESI